ncbi:hypothetical protein E2P81_ATG04236 [Venturia nashicola]|uniref:Uncharacterized protein n=1 Tax=Venturia nashicola TaxID=86259 RepID=A0A4Z1PQE6_9PEZI|nr:hypothetical protein E6O75_ATG04337 [Venturia nashicola]TLD37424.1 hypothetical protein E2P81_ATG04236 [Venturia nashicola]
MASPDSGRPYSPSSSTSAQSSGSPMAQPSALLSLPFPLRRQIWTSVLWPGGSSNVHLLRTCQQIHRETAPILLEQPLVFQSQTELFIWLEQVRDRNLEGVKSLTLYVRDLDMLSLEDDLSWPNASLIELYQLEADKILSMLKNLSGVKDLRIYHPSSVQSYLYGSFFTMILKKVASLFPGLRTFSYHSDGHPVDFLKSFTNLRELRFTGYSKSTPMETLSTLSRLRHLTRVELIPPVIPEVNGGIDIDSGLPSTLSMTRDVIKGVRRLERLSIREVSDYLMSPAYLTASFIQSVDSRHRTVLQKFEVVVKFTPDASCQRAIQNLLRSSALRHVALVWPKLDERIVRTLSRSLQTLRVAPFVNRPPHMVLTGLQARRSELPNLHTVSLVCNWDLSKLSSQVCLAMQCYDSADYIQATSAPAFKAAIQALSTVGVQTILDYGSD